MEPMADQDEIDDEKPPSGSDGGDVLVTHGGTSPNSRDTRRRSNEALFAGCVSFNASRRHAPAAAKVRMFNRAERAPNAFAVSAPTLASCRKRHR
jgi:hypothetical protein